MVLIALAALLVLPRINAIQKCCGQKESLNETNSCVPSGHQWFYTNFTYGIPDCNYTVSYAEEGASASCIDYVFETGSYKILECENNTFKVPPMNYLRKCCPMKRKYDTVKQSCYAENEDTEWPNEFLNVILGGFEGIVDVNEGAPVCPENYVLADYFLPLNQVRRDESESIILNIFNSPEMKFNPDEVCLDLTETTDFLVVRACLLAEFTCYPRGTTACVRKCCPDGESKVGKYCAPSNASITPLTINIKTGGPLLLPESSIPAYWYGLGSCENGTYILEELPTIVLSGLILDNEEFGWDEFCIEHVSLDSYSGVYVFGCFVDEPIDRPYFIYVLNVWSMSTSCFFLLLTLLVYSCLPMLRNLHGKTLMCHLSCLFIGFLSLSAIQQNILDPSEFTCKVIAHVNQFAFLGAFAWLNVISFDIWWTFGSMRPVSSRRVRDKKRFIVYSIYAWSIATFFTLGAILADLSDKTPFFLKPEIGRKFCFFEDRSFAHVIFFQGPQILVVCSNVVFFVLTAIHCTKVKNELHKIAHSAFVEKRFKADKQKLIMNVKLFIVMGISWILESTSEHIEVHSHFWIVTDIVNALQGVMIFLIFVMKKKVLKAFHRKVKEVVCNIKPKQHRPSTSTLFTVLSNEVNKPYPLKKSTSDSRLSVGYPSPRRLHQRCMSSTSTNQLGISHLSPTI